jgi:hypothetical protein
MAGDVAAVEAPPAPAPEVAIAPPVPAAPPPAAAVAEVAPVVAPPTVPEPAEVQPDAAAAPAGPAEAEAVEAVVAEPPAAPPDIESIAARRFSSRRKPAPKPARPKWRISQIAIIIAALAAVDAGLVLWRNEVVRVLPQTASLYERIGLPVNLRELAFKDIKTSYEEQDGMSILVVDGTIVATGRKVVDVPRVRFAIQAANGHEIYAWTTLPTRTKLAPGEALPFRSRLASPPEQGRSVKIRFFNRQDIASGLR